MVIGIFCSVLTGMPWGPHINKMYGEMNARRELGHFILALDLKRLMPLDLFKQRLGEMIEELHQVPPVEGFSHVYYPGEVKGERRAQRRKDGIPIDPGLYGELSELGQRSNVPFPG